MIGRKKEQKKLLEIYNNNQADLVAVYGRRRIGKTFLIQETFNNNFFFKHSGLSLDENEENKQTQKQLNNFYNSLIVYGAKNIEIPKNWFEAFLDLEKLILEKDNGDKQVIFIDELPWLDTKGSDFISAFEGFWNGFACGRKNIMVIICGSAISWIENNLINNHGGLYGRVTYEIKLEPFTLKECKEFFESKNIRFSNYDIVQAYMAIGGIPYYLNYFDNTKSLTQNINDLFFKRSSVLYFEFDRLFNSMFVNPTMTKKIVELLYTKKIGYSREEIIQKLKIADNGNLSKYLNSLIASNFIVKYIPFGITKKTKYYKLIDPYCLFYLNFIEKKNAKEDFWINNYLKPTVTSWRGYAFENICFNHIEQIKYKLGIAAVGAEISSWYYNNNSEKGQIDLLIKRNDNVINVCEIKFYSDDFVVNKDDYKKITSRCEEIYNYIPKKFAVCSTLITTYGLFKNEYSSIFQNIITLNDLFDFKRG